MNLIKLKQPMILFVFLFAVSTASFCLPDDKEKTAQLSANSADLNQDVHQGIFLGDVQFDQGTTHLRADKVVTKGNQKNQLISAIAYGNKQDPAHYWTQSTLNKPPVHAYALEIYYYPERHFIKLVGNAQVIQGENMITAAHITYDTLKQHVVALNDGQQRTTIMFLPGKKS